MICDWCGFEGEPPDVILVVTHRSVVRKKKGKPEVIEPETKRPACYRCREGMVKLEEPTVVRARRAAQAKVWKGRQEKLC